MSERTLVDEERRRFCASTNYNAQSTGAAEWLIREATRTRARSQLAHAPNFYALQVADARERSCCWLRARARARAARGWLGRRRQQRRRRPSRVSGRCGCKSPRARARARERASARTNRATCARARARADGRRLPTFSSSDSS